MTAPRPAESQAPEIVGQYSCVLLVTSAMPVAVLERLEQAIGTVLQAYGGDVQIGLYEETGQRYPGVTHQVCWQPVKAKRAQPSLLEVAP